MSGEDLIVDWELMECFVVTEALVGKALIMESSVSSSLEFLFRYEVVMRFHQLNSKVPQKLGQHITLTGTEGRTTEKQLEARTSALAIHYQALLNSYVSTSSSASASGSESRYFLAGNSSLDLSTLEAILTNLNLVCVWVKDVPPIDHEIEINAYCKNFRGNFQEITKDGSLLFENVLAQSKMNELYLLYEKIELELAACVLEMLPEIYKERPISMPSFNFSPEYNSIFVAMLYKIVVRQNLLRAEDLDSHMVLPELELCHDVESLLEELGVSQIANAWPKSLQIKHIYCLLKTMA